MRSIFPAFAVIAALLTGCRTEEARLTIASTKDVEVSRVDLKHIALKREVSESDGRFWFLFIPFGSAPTINRAMDECLESGKGDFIVNARITSFWWTILVFSWESYRIEGDVSNSIGGGAREVVSPKPADPTGVDHN